ncbi:hypothetical protein [Streptomyces sp. TRM68367]|uniref:hypothetical protein n=1 Tax=Streptomyces sp. TRM68367 TaxID=2758415 RepID=UPI00165B17A0|nr:hypothetical protein [Streptomyces sp. TRM68367]MBC9726105.1 hypothetical protein [Streptomyces sp. TRM68367]
MTRPALRMCARCERSTDAPVLVHQVHAPTGPGFNVYACPDCAPHYPPPTDQTTEILNPTHRRSRLTLRVYKIDTEETVTNDRGRVEILADAGTTLAPCTSTYPPCACPRCRTPH